jgi:hypothetical protein
MLVRRPAADLNTGRELRLSPDPSTDPVHEGPMNQKKPCCGVGAGGGEGGQIPIFLSKSWFWVIETGYRMTGHRARSAGNSRKLREVD